MTTKLWIDTDVGSDVDDALTLAWALRHPGVELVGISTVFGDVALRSEIAQSLLDLAGQGSVPVVTGLGAPLSAGRDGRMFGHEGEGLFEEPAPIMQTKSNADEPGTVAQLAEAIAQARPDALLSIGPMTNLGALARAGHALPPLTIMGGKLVEQPLPGTLPQIPEWNWWCDPDAVAAVLAAPQPGPPRVVPIEVTLGTVLPEASWRSLEDGDDALAATLGRLCEAWVRAQAERLGSRDPRVLLHDPLAAMTLVESDVCAWASRRVAIDEAGVTRDAADGCEVEVAVSVDLPRLRDHLMHVWLGAPS